MKKLFILLLKFFTPLFVVLMIYAWVDPFKVIWHYDNFYEQSNTLSPPLDKDYVSTTNYDNRYKDEHYDSFIFGNSRSIFYETAIWKKYLPANSKPYHFDASAETMYGIYKKVQYIDGKNEKMNNLLLVLDHLILERDKSLDGHLFAISPQLTGYNNIANFHLQFLRATLSYEFLPIYIEHKVTGKLEPYMTETALRPITYQYDKYTNEMRHIADEKRIADGTFYTPDVMKVFHKREAVQKCSPVVIKKNQKEMLSEIARIFKKQGTKYKITINPLYDQQKLNVADLAYLKKLFGSETVFDFSGINSITENYRNYYENSHYRPHVATAIMSEIYSK